MNNFRLEELVSKEVYELLGDRAWLLLDMSLLRDLDKFVTDLKSDTNCTAVIINDWLWGGNFNQSGFREHSSEVGAKGSWHREGGGDDLKFKGITALEAYNYLRKKQFKYPAIKRVENPEVTKTWLHIDSKSGFGPGLYKFNP